MTELAQTLSLARTSLTDPDGLPDDHYIDMLLPPLDVQTAYRDVHPDPAVTYAVVLLDRALNTLGDEPSPEHDGETAIRFLLDGLGVATLGELHELVEAGRPVVAWRRGFKKIIDAIAGSPSGDDSWERAR